MIYWLVNRRNIKPLAWGLIPLAIVVAILLLFFRAPEEQQRNLPEVIGQGPGFVQLHLAQVPIADREALSDQFRPLSAARRDRLLSHLASFRAEYRQSAPLLRVWARPGRENRRRVAEQLGNSLAQLELGGMAREAPATVPAGGAPLVLVCAQRDQQIARELLGALSVYLAGEVELRFDESTTLGSLALYVLGDPAFNAEGVAFFGEPGA